MIRRVHLLMALAAGLLLSVVTVSGALVVFRTEIDWWYADTSALSTVRSANLDATAKVLTERNSGAQIQRMVTPAFTGNGDEWILRDDRGTKDFADDEVWKVFTDPATGNVLGDTRTALGSSFIAWMSRFHHNLWLGSTGGILVGSSGLCLLGFIITGLWLWWPGIKRLRHRFRLRLNKSSFVRHYDLHSWIGLIGIPWFLVIAMTGAMFEFEWLRTAVHYGLGGTQADRPLSLRRVPPSPPSPVSAVPAETNSAKPLVEVISKSSVPASARVVGGEKNQTVDHPPLTFSSAIAAAESAITGTTVLSIIPPRPGRAEATWSVLLDYRWNAGSHSGALVQLQRDGTPKLILDPRTMSIGGWVNGQMWGLHTGAWLGAWSKMLYLLVGLLPPVLLITGTGLWWHRHRQKRKTNEPNNPNGDKKVQCHSANIFR